MAQITNIEWTETTWNPVTGCSKISPGCKNCLDPSTRVLMADMSWRPLQELRVGDRVISFTESPSLGQNRIYEKGCVEAVWETHKPAVEVMAGAKTIIASEDHLFLTYTRPQWKKAGALGLSSGIIDIGVPTLLADIDDPEYLDGYAAGAIEGDGTFKWQEGWRSDKMGFPQAYCRVAVLRDDRPILERIEKAFQNHRLSTPPIQNFNTGRPGRQLIKIETRALGNLEIIDSNILRERDSIQWRMGWLAGFFDTDGSYTGKNLRFSQKDIEQLLKVQRYTEALGFSFKIEERERISTAILTGTLKDRIRFLSTIRPALTRKCADFEGRKFSRTWTPVDGIRRIGQRRLLDIQVDRGTFIAEGFATHNCYAERMARRLQAMGQYRYRNGFDVTLQSDLVALPRSWKKPRMIFANSMSDLFHDEVPPEFIHSVFRTMNMASRHIFQVLTKRSGRLREMSESLMWTDNIWMGVSVENEDYACRIDDLLDTGAGVKFLSLEPLLGSLEDVSFEGIGWVIVG